jgi:hypothetical protein
MVAVLRFSLRFVGLYVPLLVVFGAPIVERATGTLLGAVGASTLQALLRRDVTWTLGETGGWRGSRVSLVIFPEGSGVGIMTLDQSRNIPLFAAVVLALSRRWGARMCAILAVGLAALLVFDGAMLAVNVWNQLPNWAPRTRGFDLLSVLNVYCATGAGIFAAPAFVGALAVVAFGDAEETDARRRRIPRNAPCWCGSGVKMKRCCGA